MVRESDDGGGESIIFPHLCRLRDLTYEAPIMVDIEYLRGNRVTSARVCIGWIPIMLRSSHCHLYGLNREDSTPDTIKQTGLDYAQKFECPLDPGGYFITRGTEKIILIQEQASKNRILVEKDKNGRATAQVQSSTHDKKTRADVLIKKDRILVKQNQLSERDGVRIVLDWIEWRGFIGLENGFNYFEIK